MTGCEASDRLGDQCGDKVTHSMMFLCGRCGQVHEAKLCGRHARQALQFANRGAPIRVWVVSDNGRGALNPEGQRG